MLIEKVFANRWACLILGGSLGTICRYLLTIWAFERLGSTFPYGTAMANAIGCIILGMILGIAEGRLAFLESAGQTLGASAHPSTQALMALTPQVRTLLVVGFLGALTTFSSFELEGFLMVKDGHLFKALAYMSGSVLLGFVALWLSYSWARWCFGEVKWN